MLNLALEKYEAERKKDLLDREFKKASADDADLIEAHVEEFFQQHWLRQCSGESTRDCRRALEYLLRQRVRRKGGEVRGIFFATDRALARCGVA